MSNQQLNLDLRKRQTPIQFLYGRQGESEITVEVTITDDGKTPNLEGCKLQFNCVRPDGYFVQTSEGLGSEDHFTYKLPLAATQSYGTIRAAYFAIVKDDDPTFNDSTETFVIVLEKAAAFDAEPGNYSDRLNDFVAEANELLDTLTTQQQGQKAEFDSALQKMKDDIEQATQNVEETVREIFDENEATRQSTFETNEKARSEAENEREAAEALREKNTKKAVTDAKNAVTQAKKATTAATESAEKADAAATKVEDAVNAANQAAESITSTVTDIETAEAERVEAEKGRVASEETRETNEAQRVADHQKHNEQQEANNQAQTANDAAQAQNDLAQQRNNAQQAANNEAAYNHQFVTLTDGQFDPDTRKPTLEEPMSGPVYRVPKEHPTETDKYDEWYWSVTTEGEGEWEAWTATQVAEAPAIPTDKIDRIIAGEEVSGDEVVKSTSLSYYDKARKVANDSLYAAKEATESALKDKVGQTAFDEFKQAQETKDSSQDKAIENAKTDAVSEAGQAASQALKEAVDKQSSKDTEQDSAIKEAKDAADAAAKRIPPLVTTETAGIVPPIPSDAADTQYAITIDEKGNAQWVEVEATSGGAADPRELRATIAEATRIHDTAHTDVQDDPTLHTWQNTQEAIEALQVAIDAAKKVSDGYGTEYFLQSEFNDANKALLQALEVFKSTGTEAVPNLDEFNSLKARVQKVDGETSVSANGKDITFGEKYVLTQERTTAAAAVNTANSTIQSATKQTEIDTACDTLEAAVILYESQVKTAQADNTGIDKALGDAEAAREGVVVSVDGSELEPGSRYVTDQQTLDDLASAIETATQAKSAATNQNMLDAAVSALEAAIATFNQKVKQNISIYGVKFENFPTNTKGVRTDGAADFGDVTPAVSNGSGSSPFDNIAPWSEMKAEDRTGGRMVKIPKFYYKLAQDGKGVDVQIATGPMEGFKISPAHMDRNDGKGEREAVYVGRYHCATGTYKSTSGVNPAGNATKANMLNSCKSAGDNCYMMDFATRFTIWLLYLVEFAEFNSQKAIGGGCSTGNNMMAMGYTDNMQYCTGSTAAAGATSYGGTQYRNIEGLWDNVYDFMSGCYNDGTGFNIITDVSKLGDSTGGKSVGTPANGWCGELKVSDTGGFPMFYNFNTSGGSDSAGTCDDWGFNASSPVVCVGGSYSQSTDHGVFCVSCTGATGAYAGLGCRLLELP